MLKKDFGLLLLILVVVAVAVIFRLRKYRPGSGSQPMDAVFQPVVVPIAKPDPVAFLDMPSLDRARLHVHVDLGKDDLDRHQASPRRTRLVAAVTISSS